MHKGERESMGKANAKMADRAENAEEEVERLREEVAAFSKRRHEDARELAKAAEVIAELQAENERLEEENERLRKATQVRKLEEVRDEIRFEFRNARGEPVGRAKGWVSALDAVIHEWRRHEG